MLPLESTSRSVSNLSLSIALILSVLVATSVWAISTELILAPTGEAGNAFGFSVATAGDVNGDGFDDFIVGAHGDDTGGTDVGRAYVYYGGPAADTTADLTFAGEAAGDQFGRCVSTAGDVNGDGYDDLIVGALYNDAGGADAGRAYVYFGGSPADTTADLIFTGAAASDMFGASVSTAGDINRDGYDDLIVGAKGNDTGGTNAGRAYVYLGGPAPDTSADLVLTGAAANDYFGGSVGTAGDINGDGYDDLIVGAAGNDAGGDSAGRVYVYYGMEGTNPYADLIFTGEAAYDNFGISVSTAGDVNGDGFDDVIIGAHTNEAGGYNAGRAYVYYGGLATDALADLTLTGVGQSDVFGLSVGTAGDVNGDGFDDVIVGAHGVSLGWATGQAYLYLGGQATDTVVDLILTGEGLGHHFGYSVGTAGDVNGDGFDDLIVGAYGNDTGGTNAGRAYVYDVFLYHILSPAGGEIWNVGAIESITWQGEQRADVWLSLDGGYTYLLLRDNLGGLSLNNATLLVPHAPTRFARVKLTPHDTGVPGFVESDSLFTIQSSIALLNFLVTSADGGGNLLTWDTDPGPEELMGYKVERAIGASDRWRVLSPLLREMSYLDGTGTESSKYRLTAINGLGEERLLGETSLPPKAVLSAWPLPYRGNELTISFATSSGRGGGERMAVVFLYDLQGRLVREVTRETFEAGRQVVTWDGRDSEGQAVANGVYFIRVVSEGETSQIKLVIAR